MKNSVFTLILFLFAAHLSYAADIYSAVLSHKTTDNEVFEIQFIVQTAVNDSVLSVNDYEISISDPATSQTFNLPEASFVSSTKNTVYCDSYYPSSWTQEYSITVDLNDTKYAALLSACTLRIDLSLKNRASGSTLSNGTASDLYIFEEFNNCGILSNKQSVRSSFVDQFASCQNIDAYFSLNLIDLDNDSLSYELVNPRISKILETTYKTGYSNKKPLSVPTSTTFNFSSQVGVFVFSPNDATNDKATVGVLCTEWRKNTKGVYEPISKNLQEVVFFVQNCPGNNPPKIKAPFTHEICEGEQLCFTISTEDKVKVPPPPLPAPKPDSVALRWNRGIPSATFTILNPNAQNQSGRFCWTPQQGDANNLPYSFTVTARDNFCPYSMETVRAFQIYVKPKPQGNTVIRRVTDSTYLVFNELKDTSNLEITYQLRSIDGSLVYDKNIGYFRSTESFTSTKLEDTLLIKLANDFIIQSTIENRTNTSCKVDNFDTLNYKTLGLTRVTNESLTFFPNPTRGVVSFNSVITDVRVTNCQGQLLIRKENTNTVDLSQLEPGIYYISGFDESSHYSGSVIKY